MTLIGLDVNATSARAVHGPVGCYPLGLPLDPPHHELPMVLSLETNTPVVGRSGLALVREKPHLTCGNFLADLGIKGTGARRWKASRSFLDSSQALAAVWKRLAQVCSRSPGIVLSMPSYLNRAQADLMRDLGLKNKTPVIGSLPSLLAAALAGHAEQAWTDSVLVVDIDDHALSIGLVRAVEEEAHLMATRHFPQLGLKAWRDRLINALADNCVILSRRDPRDVPKAEQALFEQLDALLDAGVQGRTIQLAIQGDTWYQNLLVHPEETHGFCTHLAWHVAREVQTYYHQIPSEESPPVLLLTAQVGRLPGLARRMRSNLEETFPVTTSKRIFPEEEDFGEGLINESHGPCLALLAPEGPSRAAHALTAFFQKRDIPHGHLESVAPLPLPQPVEAGPARLQFQGQDFFLSTPTFLLGSQIGCHLLLDGRRFPIVAPRHCEIRFDHRKFLLLNRSRAGTLVNDTPVAGSIVLQPGDWIRLGPEGPQVRFLGQPSGRQTA
jgi:hypothetical protein